MGKLTPKLTVVKLGGSLITDKDRPLTPNRRAIAVAANAIAKSLRNGNQTRLFIIHGGGSFGHYYASKFGLSTARKKTGTEGVSKTAWAMIALHSLVLNQLVREGVPCKTVLTSEFLSSDGITIEKKGEGILNNLLQSRYVPISFGNVSITPRGTSIISGDQIAMSLVRNRNVDRVIFAMDVDGIFTNSNMKGEIINELTSAEIFLGKKRKFDVTGGIAAKIEFGMHMAEHGANVYYVNGRKAERLESLIMGQDSVKSTRIYAKASLRKESLEI